VAKVLSTEDGHDEVEDVLRNAKAGVRDLLERNQCVVEGLRDALLERDELVGAEILEVIASVGPALEAQI
jgi:ATP-dependent Zn protease